MCHACCDAVTMLWVSTLASIGYQSQRGRRFLARSTIRCRMVAYTSPPTEAIERMPNKMVKRQAAPLHLRRRKSLSRVIALLLFLSIRSEAGAQSPREEGTLHVTIHLPYGISVEVPRSWRIIAGKAKEALETAVPGDIDLSRMHVPDSNLLLRANATPIDRPAWVSLAFLPRVILTPARAAKLSSSDLQDYDRELRQSVESFLRSRRMELLEWGETRKDLLNDHITLVSEYHRRGWSNPAVWEQINTIPLSAGMITLTAAYNEQAGLPCRSVVMRIRSSCRASSDSSP